MSLSNDSSRKLVLRGQKTLRDERKVAQSARRAARVVASVVKPVVREPPRAVSSVPNTTSSTPLGSLGPAGQEAALAAHFAAQPRNVPEHLLPGTMAANEARQARRVAGRSVKAQRQNAFLANAAIYRADVKDRAPMPPKVVGKRVRKPWVKLPPPPKPLPRYAQHWAKAVSRTGYSNGHQHPRDFSLAKEGYVNPYTARLPSREAVTVFGDDTVNRWGRVQPSEVVSADPVVHRTSHRATYNDVRSIEGLPPSLLKQRSAALDHPLKGHVTTCNTAAFLLRMPSLPRRVRAEMLLKASFYSSRPDFEPAVPTEPPFSPFDFIPLGEPMLYTAAGRIYTVEQAVRDITRLEHDKRWRAAFLARLAAPDFAQNPKRQRLFAALMASRHPPYHFPRPPLDLGGDRVLSGLQYQSDVASKTTVQVVRVTDLLSYLDLIRGLTSWDSLLASTWLYVRTIADPNDVQLFMEFVKDLMPTMQWQSATGNFTESMEYLFEATSGAFQNTQMGQMISQLIASVSIFGFLAFFQLGGSAQTWKTRIEFLSALIVSPKSAPIQTFAQRVISFISLLVNRAYEVIRTGDTSYFFGTAMPPSEWLGYVVNLLDSPELIINDTQPSYEATFKAKMLRREYANNVIARISREEHFRELLRLRDAAPTVGVALADHPDALRVFAGLRKRLVDEISRLESRAMNGGYRIPPFAAFIPGLPGIGKTSFTRILHRSIGQALHRSADPSTLFIPDPGANFQDTFNEGQWAVLVDDIDCDPRTTSINHAAFALKMINSAPMSMEAAGLEAKGKLWANFALVMWCTNYDAARLKDNLLAPLAFWRRFPVRIHLVPNPKFCQPGSSTLDSSLIPSGEVNLWSEYHLSRFDAALFDHDNPYLVVPFGPPTVYTSLAQFLKVLCGLAKSHVDQQKVLLTAQPELCQCGAPTAGHSDADYGIVDELPMFPNNRVCRWQSWDAFALTGLAWVCWNVRSVLMSWWASYQPLCELGVAHVRVTLAKVSRASDDVTSIIAQLRLAALLYQRRVMFALGGMALIASLSVALRLLLDKYNRTRYIDQGAVEAIVDVPNIPKALNPFKRVPLEYSRPYAQLQNPGVSYEQLQDLVGDLTVNLVYNTPTHESRVKGIILTRGYILTVRHLFSDLTISGRPAVLELGGSLFCEQGLQRVTIDVVDETRFFPLPNRDLALVWVPELVNLSSAVWKALSPTSQAAVKLRSDSAIFVVGRVKRECPYGVASINFAAEKRCTNFTWEGEYTSFVGECGGLILGKFGNNFAVLGMHTLTHGKGIGQAEDLVRCELQVVMDEADLTHPTIMDVTYQSMFLAKDVNLGPLPEKSSLWANLSSDTPLSCLVGGTLPGFACSTFKSAVIPMPHAGDWQDLELDICGAAPYHVAPSTKGSLVGTDWVDPWTVNLQPATNKSGDMRVWRDAVLDYLTGVELLRCRDAARPLSEYEAFLGIDGTVLGGFDWTTGMGPPHGGPKNRYVRIDRDKGTIDIHPELREQLDYIDAEFAAGRPISPVSHHVPKDEPISVTKFEAHKQRIFNIVAFCFNLRAKQYVGPITAFMRQHPFYFESAIGMDVRSADWSTILEWCSAFPNWGCGDNSAFDVHASTIELIYSSEVFVDLARVCHYTPEEINYVKMLAVSFIYMTRVIKGDVFYTSFMMPTGFWMTIFLNGVRNSLQRRYAFLTLYPRSEKQYLRPPVLFRDQVRQLVLGDDNIFTTKLRWFNQEAIQRALLDFGAVLTDASKRATITPFEKRGMVTFLKRYFVVRDEMVLAPIEKKTLVKMLTVRMKSTLSNVDHVSMIYSNVLSESWMWGENFFNYVAKRVEKIVVEDRLVSQYLVRRPYLEYVEMYRTGKLSVWNPLLSLENELV